MKRTMGLLAVVAVLGVVSSFVLAADPTSKPVGTEGTFVKMDGANLVMTVKDKNTPFLTDDTTAVTVDGKEGTKLTDLKAGMKLVVTMNDGKPGAAVTVAKVVAKSPATPKAAA